MFTHALWPNRPRRSAAYRHPAVQLSPGKPRPGKRILLVDDDFIAPGSLTDVLVAEGNFVIPAANGQEVLAFADKLPADLALLDLDMLAKSTRKTFKRLTRDHPLIPVIFATAHSNHLPAGFRDGTSVLLEKPIRVPKLLRTVKKLLRPSPTPRASKNPPSATR